MQENVRVKKKEYQEDEDCRGNVEENYKFFNMSKNNKNVKIKSYWYVEKSEKQ